MLREVTETPGLLDRIAVMIWKGGADDAGRLLADLQDSSSVSNRGRNKDEDACRLLASVREYSSGSKRLTRWWYNM